MSIRGIGPWLKRTYDRIIASVVLLVLFVSLIMLAVNAQLLKGQQQAFDKELSRLKPKHEQAAPLDRSGFESDHRLLDSPLQVAEWTNHLLLPELRVSCVNCDRPIVYSATNCPYCNTPQPVVVNVNDVDRDNDGMPDVWEIAHGFNPLDPSDANEDADNDGFTNLEEYRFGTNPRDPASHPPPLAKITVGKIMQTPCPLVFMSASKLQDNVYMFQINRIKDGRTFNKKMGDEVEGFKGDAMGFKIVAFDMPPTPPGAKEPPPPTLTVERAGKRIPLVKGNVASSSEYEIALVSGFDGSNISVRVDSEFDVKGFKYRVKKVDTEKNSVLIHDPSRDTDVWIRGETPKAPSIRGTKEEGP